MDEILYTALKNGDLDTIEDLFSHGTNIETVIAGECTPLQLACCFNHLNIVQYLCSQGANIECKDNDGYTPLHFSSEEGYFDIVQFLCSQGANIGCLANFNKLNKGKKDAYKIKCAPILLACLNGRKEVYDFLKPYDNETNYFLYSFILDTNSEKLSEHVWENTEHVKCSNNYALKNFEWYKCSNK